MGNTIKIYNCPEDCNKVDILTDERDRLYKELKKSQYTQFELMAEIEDLARINEILIARYKSSKDIDLIKAGELDEICNNWLTLKKEAGE